MRSTRSAPESVAEPAGPLRAGELDAVHAWWRAVNYLSVGQIHLMGNPLLREPLAPEHVEPRLLGHWGTTPRPNVVDAHVNRVIAARDLDVMYVMGPGHGGPGPVAAAWPEGTCRDVYPEHRQYIRTHGQDLPEVRDWQWSGTAGPPTSGGDPLREPEA